MTEAEFADFVARARRRAAAELAALDRIDRAALSAEDRAALDQARAELLDLWASLEDGAIAAELEATVHAGRDLTPAEVAALRGRH